MLEPQEFVQQELRNINNLFSKQKEIYPMVVLIKEGRRHLIPVYYENDAHKDIVSQGIKDLVKRAEPDIVIYMSEAWMITVKDKFERLHIPRPKDHPDKVEILVVHIEFKTGEKFGCQANILRNTNPPCLSKFEIFNADLSAGRFIDFYPQKRVN
jgi:hypothetical protein